MSKWIKVEDALPETGIGVLVFCNGHSQYGWRRDLTGYKHPRGAWKVGIGATPTDGVTHWMPMPKGPK